MISLEEIDVLIAHVENEHFVTGYPTQVIALDNHKFHIRVHLRALFGFGFFRAAKHIYEHFVAMQRIADYDL